MTFRAGTYVIDTSDTARYCRSLYRVVCSGPTRASAEEHTIVQRVGHFEGKRINATGDRGITHRLTKNLKEHTW